MKDVNEIGILSAGTRMKRLYDELVRDARELYKSFDLDFDPKWFAILYTLYQQKENTITGLARMLKLSHPAIIKSIKGLENAGWVKSSRSEKDKRSRIVRLTDRATQERPKIEEVWQYMRVAFEDINKEGQIDFWEGLNEFERSLLKKSFKERVNEIRFENVDSSNLALHPNHPGRWFDRKFDFAQLSVSVEGLIERLRFTPLRLRERVKNLSARDVTHSVDGKWSIKENVGHLNDLEPLWHTRIEEIVAGVRVMKEADLSNTKTHEAEHNQIPLEKLLSQFTTNRAKLVNLCEQNSEVLTTASAIHPRLDKPMKIVDLMYFVAEHDDHHLATISHVMFKMRKNVDDFKS